MAGNLESGVTPRVCARFPKKEKKNPEKEKPAQKMKKTQPEKAYPQIGNIVLTT